MKKAKGEWVANFIDTYAELEIGEPYVVTMPDRGALKFSTTLAHLPHPDRTRAIMQWLRAQSLSVTIKSILSNINTITQGNAPTEAGVTDIAGYRKEMTGGC